MKKLFLAAAISSFAVGATAGGMNDGMKDGMDEMAEATMEEPEVGTPNNGGQGLLILLAIAVIAVAAS